MSTRVSKFRRETDQRRALVKSLANSLVLYETMTTTVTRAKAAAIYVEKLVKFAKTDTVANRRLLRSRLTTDASVKKLVEELAPAWKERQGGYTRVIKAGNRVGDNAPMAVVALVLPKVVKAAPIEEKPEKAERPKAAAKKPAAKKAVAKPKAKAGKK